MRFYRKRVILVILLFIALVAFLILAVSCNADDDSGQTRLEIRIEDDSSGSRTIMPSQTLMKVAKYSVSGSGPGDTSFGPVISSEKTLSIQNLVSGSWEVCAKALNVENNEIASGTGTVEITQGENSVVVVLDQMTGTGTLQLDISWDCSFR